MNNNITKSVIKAPQSLKKTRRKTPDKFSDKTKQMLEKRTTIERVL